MGQQSTAYIPYAHNIYDTTHSSIHSRLIHFSFKSWSPSQAILATPVTLCQGWQHICQNIHKQPWSRMTAPAGRGRALEISASSILPGKRGKCRPATASSLTQPARPASIQLQLPDGAAEPSGCLHFHSRHGRHAVNPPAPRSHLQGCSNTFIIPGILLSFELNLMMTWKCWLVHIIGNLCECLSDYLTLPVKLPLKSDDSGCRAEL